MSHQPTRSQAIGAFVIPAVTASALTWNQYAERVVQHYHDRVPVLTDRVVEFHVATTADNFDHFTRLNTQTVKRVLSGENRMPADLEESLVAALDAADRERLQMQLLDRAGLLYAPKPVQGPGGEVVASCELLRRAADAVQRIAPMLADGRITIDDAPHLLDAARGLQQVMGACISLNVQIAAAGSALGGKPVASGAQKAVH